jgi:hypothetical protein
MKLISSAALVALLCACSNKPNGPATYEYSVHSGHVPNSGDFQVFINGKPAGTSRSATVPRGTLLSDPATNVEVVVPTTCGDERIAVKSLDGDRSEETKRRSAGGTVSWEIYIPETIREMPLYLDNSENAKAATIKIGTRIERLAAKEARGNQMIILGTCATARDLVVDDKAQGQVPKLNPNGALLVGALADQCYAKGYAKYVTGSGLGNAADISPEVQVFRVEGHATVIPHVEYFPESAAPQKKLMEENDPNDTVSVMTPLPCDVAAAYLKARGH